VIAFGLASGLGLIDLRLSTVPLTLFVMLCGVAPFLPRLGFFLPVVSRGSRGTNQVALTFDDGPDPASTPKLLALLERHGIRATFFVIGQRAARHPDLIRAMVRQGHEIGNHSWDHDHFIMFWRSRRLAEQIVATQRALATQGVVPRVFRPPVGITTPVLAAVLGRQGMVAVNFSCRAFDGGNRRIRGLSKTILSRLRAGDIVLLHDAPPPKEKDIDRWIDEVEKVVQGLARNHLSAVPLSRLMGRPVMDRND
jgi:peptidoglycan/xylan/chitin deacetylase (PgdA/CDA1 family)